MRAAEGRVPTRGSIDAMDGTPLPDLVLYGRDGCHLCEETSALLRALLERRATLGAPVPRLVERSIQDDPAWERAFLVTIPVVEIGDRRLELAIGAAKLRRFLAETLDGAATGRAALPGVG